MRIAIPAMGGVLSPHFARCEHMVLFDVENGQVVNRFSLVPPPHGPGVLPEWLRDKGANVIIASGMGRRAQALFDQHGIRVLIGAQAETPDEIVASYLQGTLEAGENVCEH
jgi:ATP-binding protein involved in chromosome partitioning